jgi:peptidoglycan/xylan/chitin deacetylase (PgdA/CDA1 family)
LHIVTLSFDDGFRRSNTRIAGIYERFGLKACMNVLAAPEELVAEQEEWGTDRGDWALWNELQARGHEIMPHGYKHADKRSLPIAEARSLILRCLDIFEGKLEGFRRQEAVFNFPYNRSSKRLERWLPTIVRGFRAMGGYLNPLPYRGMTKVTCGGYGPDNCEHDLDRQLERLFSLPSGWLVYNTHGLDGEGWGPVSTGYLERLLGRLVEMEGVEVLPTGVALARAWEGGR